MERIEKLTARRPWRERLLQVAEARREKRLAVRSFVRRRDRVHGGPLHRQGRRRSDAQELRPPATPHAAVARSPSSEAPKRRALTLAHARSAEQRLPRYRALIAVTKKTLIAARTALSILPSVRGEKAHAEVNSLVEQLSHHVPAAERVLDQAERRVLRGRSVPAQEKVISTFEPHVLPLPPARASPSTCSCFPYLLHVLPQVPARASPTSCTCFSKYLLVLPLPPARASPSTCSCFPYLLHVLLQARARACPTSCTCFPKHVLVLPLPPARASPSTCSCLPYLLHVLPQVRARTSPTSCTCFPKYVLVLALPPARASPSTCSCLPHLLLVLAPPPARASPSTCSRFPKHVLVLPQARARASPSTCRSLRPLLGPPSMATQRTVPCPLHSIHVGSGRIAPSPPALPLSPATPLHAFTTRPSPRRPPGRTASSTLQAGRHLPSGASIPSARNVHFGSEWAQLDADRWASSTFAPPSHRGARGRGSSREPG
ncbi:uncharacterized protein CMC5_029740 [Chondromyces crocatus]|uniref:Uncharacterized protein n=1 Tax=Chondromyces crocatus TaxID=52 RepID=A0A0K1EE17_CHOCO|nr:uncharacterized protein CMC5_029740 [Chondromyces crocatus]